MIVPVFGTALAVDPARVPLDVVLFLPDWQANFHLVDDVAARLECLVAVSRRYADPYGTFAYLKQAGTMHARDVQ